MTTSSLQIVQQWTDSCRSTIKAYDHPGHMNLISRQVQVFGIPDFDVITYDDWFAHSQQEFGEKHILDATYDSIKIRHESEKQIMFVTMETITAADHSTIKQAVEVVLSNEFDDIWRLTQERLLDQAEAKIFGIVI